MSLCSPFVPISCVVTWYFSCLFLFCGRISVETVCLTLSTICDVTICLSESPCSSLSQVFLPAYLSLCPSVCPSVMFVLFFFSSFAPHSEHRFPAPSSKLCQNWLYTTTGALFISAQLSTDAISALRKVWVLIRLWKHHSVQARHEHEARPPLVKKERKKSVPSREPVWPSGKQKDLCSNLHGLSFLFKS